MTLGMDNLKITEIIEKNDDETEGDDKHSNDKNTKENDGEDVSKKEVIKKPPPKKEESKKTGKPETGPSTEMETVCNLLKSLEREVLESNKIWTQGSFQAWSFRKKLTVQSKNLLRK